MAKKLKQLQNAKPGDKCVVADYVGTTIYTIKAVDNDPNGCAELEYPADDGRMISGGRHPLYCCYVPTKQQLAHKE